MKINTLFTILYVLLLISCSDTNKKQSNSLKDKETKIPIFLMYGELPPTDYAGEKDSLKTLRYGFLIKRVAGCDVTDGLIDSVETVNKNANQQMQQKYGKNWRTTFEKQSKLKFLLQNGEE